MSNGVFEGDLVRVLLLVQEAGSLAGVAERLGVTQQAVSAQLKRIEAMVGRRVVERGGGRATVTADGMALLAYGREARAIEARMRRHFDMDVLVGLVRVGLIEGFASTLLPTVLAALRFQQPRLEVHVETGLTDRLLARLEHGQLDTVLGLQKAGQTRGEVLWRDRLRWMGDPHVVEADRPVPLVLPPQPALFRGMVIERMAAAGRPFAVVFESESQISRRAAMLTGSGLGVSCAMLEGAAGGEIAWVEGLPELDDVEFFIRTSNGRDELLGQVGDILRQTAREVLPHVSIAAF